MTVLRSFAVLLASVLLGAGTPAMSAAGIGQDPQGHGDKTHKTTAEMDNAAFFKDQYAHLVPHEKLQLFPEVKVGDTPLLSFYDVNLYQLIALALMFLVFMQIRGSFGKPGQPNWFTRVFRGWCLWLRDEMVYSVMGKEEGKAFAPYFIYLFFFLAFCNLVSLVPGQVTANATFFVTAALAIVTLVLMVVGGMMRNGVVSYWQHLLVPPGLPKPLLPLMIVLELIGLLVKPFALTVRLFANMLAGHLVVYSFIGMIFLFAKLLDFGAMSWLTAVPSVGLAVFIYIIEAFVALLQAYIFTYLSIIFVQQSLHPAH